MLTTLRELNIDTAPFLASQIHLYSGLLAFEILLFLISSVYNLSDLKCDWVSHLVCLWFSQTHTMRLFHLSSHRLLVFFLPAIAVWWDEDTQCRCLQKWLPTWHSTVHQLPTWIHITHRVFVPVIFSLHLQHNMPFFPTISTPHSFFISTFFPQITSPQSSTASQGVSFNLSSFSGYFCFPLPLYFLPLHFSFVHLTFLFRVNTAAFSHLAMYQFVWTGNSSFSLTWVSSHHPITFIFIPSLFTSSLCAFLCLLLPV